MSDITAQPLDLLGRRWAYTSDLITTGGYVTAVTYHEDGRCVLELDGGKATAELQNLRPGLQLRRYDIDPHATPPPPPPHDPDDPDDW